MSCSTSKSNYIFQEAYNHSRRKTLIKTMGDTIEMNISSYSGKTFEEVLSSITQLSKQFPGIGPLGIYDISSGISQWNGIPVKRVYIIGGGPKRAAKLLNLPLKTFKTGNRTYKYTEISDVLEALKKRQILVNDKIKKNGDALESFLCVWQKNIN
jgi:hypothetical protein